ncbi:MAG: radical SAM protein [Chloroflexi bacterium]|nr:radical SAM protein [Chloroflexota bacterium]
MAHRPHLISWNLTRRCNLRCAHCYLEAGAGGPSELSPQEARGLVDQMAALGTEMLILTGGEPLLYPGLFDVAQCATERGLAVVLGTNGTLLDGAAVRRLGECGVKGVGISLDSCAPAVHDAFRGVEGAWEGAVRAMALCREEGLPCLVQATATPENYHEIPSLVDFAHRQGAAGFTLYFLVCTGRGEALTDITPQQYEEALALLTHAQQRCPDLLVRARCAPHIHRVAQERDSALVGSAGCPAGTGYCRITPEGGVTPCPYLPLALGNIRERPLKAIWEESPLLSRLRAGELGGRCGRCEYRVACGGCRGRAYGLTGDPLGEDPWCLHEPGGNEAPRAEIGVEWEEAALRRLEGIPAFIRGRVRQAVEGHARAQGHSRITPEVMAQVRQAMGSGPFPWRRRR